MKPIQEMEDPDLLRQIDGGNPAALAEILRRYQGKVYGLSVRMLRNPQDAEEVLQDVALVLSRKAGSFRGGSAVSSWVYRIAVNACLMKLRRRPKVEMIPLEEEMGPETDERGMTVRPIADWSALPRDAAGRRELIARIGEAAMELPPEHRAVFLLRDVEGFTAAEACRVLGISLPALKSRLHRARLFLRKRLADHYYEEGRTGGVPAGEMGRSDAHVP